MPTSTPKTIKINENSFVFQYFLQNRPFEVDIDFWFDFGANMPPFSLQKSIKIGSKLELGRHRIFDRFLHGFLIDFPSIWEANLEVSWPLRGAQDASKTHPRRLQDGSQDEVRDMFRFWSNFGWCWFDFWLISHWFLVRFLVGVWFVFNQFFNDFLTLGSIFGRLLQRGGGHAALLRFG